VKGLRSGLKIKIRPQQEEAKKAKEAHRQANEGQDSTHHLKQKLIGKTYYNVKESINAVTGKCSKDKPSRKK